MGTCYDIEKEIVRNREPFEVGGVRYVPERICVPTIRENYIFPRFLEAQCTCGAVLCDCYSKKEYVVAVLPKYCPNCGARIEKEKLLRTMETWSYLCDRCGRKGKDRGMHECWCRNKLVIKKAICGRQNPLDVCPDWTNSTRRED